LAESQVSRQSVFLGWAICGLGAIFYTYEYLLRIEPSVMVPELMAKFQLTAEEFGFITSLYYIAYTPMQLVVGLTTDIMGPRKTLTAAVLICALGSLLFGSTDAIWLAGTGRFMVGFGSAFAFVGVLKLAAIWLPDSRFAFFAGLATALGMVGAMMGVVQLSALVARIGWEQTVFIGTIIGFILVPIIWLVVRDTHGDPTYMEPLERVTLSEALRGLRSIAGNIQMWYCGAIGLALYMSLSVFGELWGVDFLEKTFGFSSKDASLANAMVFGGWLVGAPLVGWFSDMVQ
jgi:sugar phosphate permease